MSEGWRATQLACRNPSMGLAPLPTVSGSTLQPILQIPGGHRINVDANILGKETCKGLQKSAFEIAVDIFKRSNHQGKTCDEANRRLRMTVYESGHVVELGFTKKQHVAAGGEKRIDATKQVGNFRGWFVRLEWSNVWAKETSGRRFFFAKGPPKLLNCRSQQSQMNVRVHWIGVAEVPRRKHDGFLVENLGR